MYAFIFSSRHDCEVGETSDGDIVQFLNFSLH